MEDQEVQSLPKKPPAIFKKRNAAGKAKFRKRAVSQPPSSSNSDDSSSEDEAGKKIKRRKHISSSITASSGAIVYSTPDLEPTRFNADRSTTIKSSNDATKSSNWYEQNKNDAVSSKRSLVPAETAPVQQLDGNYTGLANTKTFIAKNPNAPNQVVGPVKAPTNLRTITVTDFAPDVCKDYKQTGFCGFGDSCKYLHAREDYKHGWQLDKEWENVTKGKKIVGGTKVASADRKVEENDSDDDTSLENIPFACILCKKSYQNPIITKCGHYFCENCALKMFKKTSSCAACGAGTGGVFNVAKGLKKLLEKKRERVQRNRQKAVEAGEEVSEEEDPES
ncbi:BgTH12-02079 [Blumeria graminis f. sp. triticale]|uniref:Pre-mRNA-splicing factor CWC24 n=2 Tax=Blumeria graminis TaxID=34373 RepID=A0A9W4GEM8_BLUGR|nr:BgTH12-02079 [Blumeria graminis f. sp. triticale]